MRKKNLFIILIALFMLLALASCEKKKKTTNEQENANNVSEESKEEEKADQTKKEEENLEPAPAVVLYENLPLRETASTQGKWITGLSLGEEVRFSGEKESDSSGKSEVTYLKIQRLDGSTEGWTSEYFCAVNAVPAVLMEDVSPCKQPSIATMDTALNIPKGSIIAIIQDGDYGEFIKIKWQRKDRSWIDQGYIKGSSAASDPKIIAVARILYLVKSDTFSKSTEDKKKKLDLILKNFPDSPFLAEVTQLMKDLQKEDTASVEAEKQNEAEDTAQESNNDAQNKKMEDRINSSLDQ